MVKTAEELKEYQRLYYQQNKQKIDERYIYPNGDIITRIIKVITENIIKKINIKC